MAKKSKKKPYFGMDVQDAIIRYNGTDEQKQVENMKSKFDELFT